MRSWSSKSGSWCVVVALLASPGCGDDGSSEGSDVTGPSDSTGPATSSSTGDATGSGSTSSESTSSGGGDSSSSGDGDSTGAAEDPSYPMPDGGACEGSTAPIVLPGGQICSPFCTGRGDSCPAAASGDAPAECTPFLGEGGSGDPCDEGMPCEGGEVCGNEGMCGEVAFWACQLACAGGQTCPDGMTCSGIGTCGYP